MSETDALIFPKIILFTGIIGCALTLLLYFLTRSARKKLPNRLVQIKQNLDTIDQDVGRAKTATSRYLNLLDDPYLPGSKKLSELLKKIKNMQSTGRPSYLYIVKNNRMELPKTLSFIGVVLYKIHPHWLYLSLKARSLEKQISLCQRELLDVFQIVDDLRTLPSEQIQIIQRTKAELAESEKTLINLKALGLKGKPIDKVSEDEKNIKIPFRTPFSTSLWSYDFKEVVLVQVDTRDGLRGYGECDANKPCYSYEDRPTNWHILRDYLVWRQQGRLPPPGTP